jgi:Subtilisin-like serine proteases
VHLGAPGVGILSTVPTSLFTPPYLSVSGTSMAAPHVAGVAALLAAQDSTRDWKAIRNLILAGGETRAVYFDGERFANVLNQTVTRKHLNAFGALTCTNSPLLSRLQPQTNEISFAQGLEGAVDIAVLHINCGTPNGNVEVLVDGGAEVLTLLDDGQGADQEAGDGIYSGQWIPNGIRTHTFAIPNAELRLNDSDELDDTTIVVDDVFRVHVLSPYRFSADSTSNYRALTGTELFLGDDDWRQIAPGFPILFGGGSFEKLYVNSNGNITITKPFTEFFNRALPTVRATSLIAPFWDDLDPSGGRVFWEVGGERPEPRTGDRVARRAALRMRGHHREGSLPGGFPGRVERHCVQLRRCHLGPAL